MQRSRSLFIRTITVGTGISPILLTLTAFAARRSRARHRAITAGGDLHPALRTCLPGTHAPDRRAFYHIVGAPACAGRGRATIRQSLPQARICRISSSAACCMLSSGQSSSGRAELPSSLAAMNIWYSSISP